MNSASESLLLYPTNEVRSHWESPDGGLSLCFDSSMMQGREDDLAAQVSRVDCVR